MEINNPQNTDNISSEIPSYSPQTANASPNVEQQAWPATATQQPYASQSQFEQQPPHTQQPPFGQQQYVQQQQSYGQQQAYSQQPYEQQGYQSPYPAAAPAPRVFPQPGNKRALAMSFYCGLPAIFGAICCDRSDPFLMRHLNQGLVLLIASVICSLLAIILIGGLLAIVVLVFDIMGMVAAYNGEDKPLPLIENIRIIK